MTTAREIFSAYTKAMAAADAAAAAACFTEDGALEFPCSPLLGLNNKYQGHKDLEAYLHKLHVFVPGFEFIDFKVHIDTPDAMFAECRVDKPRTTDADSTFTTKCWFSLWMARSRSSENSLIRYRRRCFLALTFPA